ncbi:MULTISPECIES: lipopolysaccharide biosynthesis protein [Bacteroides]|uniref:lipopolysaccharide biosynthesis protein n=1 Tax=Bacteroides TaxID=816 RepID=UPI0018A08DC5|nr:MULTISPECIES: hypothetical protein [Bacteroides]MDC2614247.1 hypothetical protein [Bacteroides ovatus]MDC2633671.1 hypothetical protein [Bacteroides ovatus]
MHIFRNRIKSFLQHPIFKLTAIYTVTDGITKSISFIVLPIVSYFIVPSELGIAANFDVLQNIIILLAGQVLVNSLPYFYYERTKKEVSILVSNLLFLVLLVNVILAIIILFCTNIIEGYLHIGLSLQLLTVLSSFCMLANNVNFILYKMEDSPISFAKLQIGQVILYVGLLVILVVGYNQQALGKILSYVVAISIMSFIHLYLLYKRGYLIFKIELNIQKTLVQFGIPLLPHSLSFWIKSGMDKIILTTYCGLNINGIYSMALSFGAVYALFNTSFSNAYVPELQKRLSKMTPENEREEKKFLVKLSYKLGGVFCVLCFLVIILCWLVVHYILSEQYAASFQYIPWIILSSTIYSFYGLVIQYPYTVKKTFGLGLVTFLGSIFQLLLTFLLVKTIGADGIKYSLVLGSLVIMLGVWWYSNKVYPMPWLSRL